MNNSFLQNIDTITTFSVIFFIVLFIVIFSLVIIKKSRQNDISAKLDEVYSKIHNDIKFAVTPKFMQLSLGVNELIDLAVEVWRIEQRIAKSVSNLPENQLKGFENSAQKMRRYLEKCDIEIVDYKNTKYNEGLNLDVLSVEKDPSLPESIVKETVEPTILCKGQVVRKAKIILLKNH